MKVQALIELPSSLPDSVLQRVALSAYSASVAGEVVLVLPSTLRSSVESALDVAVSRIGLDVCGVRYCDRNDEGLLELAAEASVVAASSDRFMARLTAGGIAFHPFGDGSGDRGTESSGPGPVERTPGEQKEQEIHRPLAIGEAL